MPPYTVFLVVALVALLAGPPSHASAQSDPVIASRAAYTEAVHAHESHDFPGFLFYAREAERLRPAHGGMVYGWPAPTR